MFNYTCSKTRNVLTKRSNDVNTRHCLFAMHTFVYILLETDQIQTNPTTSCQPANDVILALFHYDLQVIGITVSGY